jgi:hypothetical protein
VSNENGSKRFPLVHTPYGIGKVVDEVRSSSLPPLLLSSSAECNLDWDKDAINHPLMGCYALQFRSLQINAKK